MALHSTINTIRAGLGRTLICDPDYIDSFSNNESFETEIGSEIADSSTIGDIVIDPAFPVPAPARASVNYEKIISSQDEILVNRDEVIILESELIKFVDDDLDAMTPASHIGKVKKENGTMAFKIPNYATYYPLTLRYNDQMDALTLNFVGVDDINGKMYVIQRGSNIEIVLNVPEEEQHEWYNISCYTLNAGNVFMTEVEYQDRIILNYDLSAYKGFYLYLSVRGEMSLNEYVTGFGVQ